jgi:hypothetical protein
MDKQLNQAGNFTGTFKLGTGIEDDAELIGASYPQRCCIYCQRNGVTVWGGIIWSRTFESNAKTCQLSAQTFESYMNKVIIEDDFERYSANQLQTAIDLIAYMQTLDRSNIGIDLSYVDITGGNIKDTAAFSYDYKSIGEVFSELSSSDDGFDYTINAVDGPITDSPIKQLLVGQPKLVPGDADNITVYDYPGTIDQFYWPESGSDAGTDFIVLGSGSGSDMLVSRSTWAVGSGYPRVNKIFNFKNVTDQATLDSIAQDIAQTYGPTATVPTISLASDRDPEFDQWNALGTTFQIELESPRWEDRKVFQSRMVGWEFQPADSDNNETIKIRIEGDEDGE